MLCKICEILEFGSVENALNFTLSKTLCFRILKDKGLFVCRQFVCRQPPLQIHEKGFYN